MSSFPIAEVVYYVDFLIVFNQVMIRGSVLGLTLGLSIILAQSTSTLRLVGWFIIALTFFHWSEYVATGVTNPRNLSLSSFILNHSVEYHAAIAASLAEFFIESYFFPS